MIGRKRDNRMTEYCIEVLPGIYQLELHSEFKGVDEIKIYIVPGKDPKNDRSLMIDVGFHDDNCMACLEEVMGELGITFERLDVFLTHKHHDHCGLASQFAKKGSRIFMNPEEERHHYDCLHYNVKYHEDQKEVLRYVGITENGTPELWEMFTLAVEEDRIQEFNILHFPYLPVKEGDCFSYGEYTFRTVALPGHTFGQMGLAEDRMKVFFSGDQVIRGIVPIVGTSFKDEHLLSSYFASLRRIGSEFADYRLYPSHKVMLEGKAIKKTVDRIVFAYLEKIQIIEQVVRHSRRPMTVVQVAMLAYGMKELPGNKEQLLLLKMITSKTFSCLEYLRDEDFVCRTEEDGVLYWEG